MDAWTWLTILPVVITAGGNLHISCTRYSLRQRWITVYRSMTPWQSTLPRLSRVTFLSHSGQLALKTGKHLIWRASCSRKGFLSRARRLSRFGELTISWPICRKLASERHTSSIASRSSLEAYASLDKGFYKAFVEWYYLEPKVG
jgi:hypothetical protein